MCRNRFHKWRAGWRVGIVCLLLAGLGAAGNAWSAEAATDAVAGDTIDITGTSDLPKWDTRVAWSPPQGFEKDPFPDAGKVLRDDLLIPVDRVEMERRTEVERQLSW